MDILTALKSSEIGDNMTDAFISQPELKRYPFYPAMDQITPNTMNYNLIQGPQQTVTARSLIRDKIPRNYYLRGIFLDLEAIVTKAVTGNGKDTDYNPFDINSFGLFKLIRYVRILQANKEIKKIDFNNIIDIITNKYDAFTADSIFSVGSNNTEFRAAANASNTTITGLLYIPFSFSQMAKLAPDTSLLHPLELEIAVGNEYDNNSIYTVIYRHTDADFDTLTVTSLKITPKYQFSAVDDIFYSELKKNLYGGEVAKIYLDYSYISYNKSVNGAANAQLVEIPLNLNKLVKRYFIRSLRQNTAAAGSTNSEFVDGSDKISNIKLMSGNRTLYNMNKSEATLISIVLGNSYRTASSNAIFGGHTLDATNGFLHEKNNDYSSGFPEAFLEDPKLILTLDADPNSKHHILITAEYYEVCQLNPKNGILSLMSDK
jgi:hypothetical protein